MDCQPFSTVHRRLRAAELSLAGLSSRQVAKELGCSQPVALKHIKRGLDVLQPPEDAKTAFVMVRERINEVYATNRAGMLKGERDATQHCQKAIDQMMKLYRLDVGTNTVAVNIDPNSAEVAGIEVRFVAPAKTIEHDDAPQDDSWRPKPKWPHSIEPPRQDVAPPLAPPQPSAKDDPRYAWMHKPLHPHRRGVE